MKATSASSITSSCPTMRDATASRIRCRVAAMRPIASRAAGSLTTQLAVGGESDDGAFAADASDVNAVGARSGEGVTGASGEGTADPQRGL